MLRICSHYGGIFPGFTAFCESYCSDAKSKHDGADQLTSTLNQYLSQIVQGNTFAAVSKVYV